MKIKTTAAESPWSNGLIERHNGIIGESVTKTIEDVGCNLEIALAWAISAKNSLQNNNGFSPNQLVFGKNPSFPSVLVDQLPALEGKTSSEIIAENLNAMHVARKTFIEAESSEKIRRALRHNIRTTGDIKYFTGDNIYYKRNDSNLWKGPATVIGQDNQQVLVKHGSVYVRVHPCRLTLVKKTDFVEEREDITNKESGSPGYNQQQKLGRNEYFYNEETDRDDIENNLDNSSYKRYDNIVDDSTDLNISMEESSSGNENMPKKPKVKSFIKYLPIDSQE